MHNVWNRLLIALGFLMAGSAGAQKIEIILGPGEIGENQIWTITVSVHNDNFRTYDAFPVIEGFRNRGTSSQSQTSIVNGQMSMVQSVIMSYQPTRQGTFTLPPFRMKINGQAVSSPGRTIRVGPAAQQNGSDPFGNDPFGDFFSRREQEFIEVKEDAMLALTTSKSEVYVGEGFTVTLSFLIAESNRATMQFHELGEQLTDILKKLRPEACWEENFNIENIEGERIEINGKGFTQYKIYQAAFYPLNDKPIVFPEVGLKMIKFKVAKNPSFFGQNRQEDFKTFFTTAKKVRVKPLPPHPLRETVAVGNFMLQEDLSESETETGKSISYTFTVLGEGNIAGIPNPTILPDSRLEWFDPNIIQDVNRSSGHVTGSKSFRYFLIPQEAGSYPLGDYLSLIFFHPGRGAYDTLRPQATLAAFGESRQNVAMSGKDATSFYDRMSGADNSLRSIGDSGFFKLAANLFILLALGASVYMVFRK